MANLNTALGFKITNPAPADAKYIAENLAGIQSIIGEGNAYEGMQCYIPSEKTLYILTLKEGKAATSKAAADWNITAVMKDGKALSADADALTVAWGKVTDTPTTRDGYALSDVYTKTETDTAIGVEETRATTAEGNLAGRLDVIEGEGAGSIKKAVKDLKESLDAEITSSDGARVQVKVTEVDGKITAVNVAENDIAKNSDLISEINRVGAIPTGATATTVVGYAAEVAAVAQAEADGRIATLEGKHASGKTVAQEVAAVTGTPDSGKTLQAEIDAVEADITKLNGNDQTAGSVAKAIKDAVEALDSEKSSATVTTGAEVTVKEVDGKIDSVTVSNKDIASAAALTKLQTAVGVSELTGGAKSVKARLDVLEGAETVAGSVAKALKDAKDYADGLDSAADSRLDALEAKHASGKTVAQEVADGIANLRDGADEAFDTLKEIANWINNSDANADGFNAAQRITNLETAVDAANLVVADGKTKTVANAIAKAVADEAAAARAAEGANATAIGTEQTRAEGVESGLQSAIDTLNGNGDGSVAKALQDAKDYADGKIGTLTKDTVVAEIADAKAAGTAAKINTVSFNSGSALAGSFASNTLTLTDIAQASVLAGEATNIDNLQALIGESALSENEKTVVARLNTLEGSNTTAGSVAKALKDAKDYADGLDTAMDARVDKLEATHATGSTTGTYKTVAEEITAVTGTPDFGKTLQAEIDAVEASVATLNGADNVAGSVAKAIKDLKESLDTPEAGVSGNSARVTVNVKQTNGVVSSVTVTENDIAQASVLTALSNKVGNATDGQTAGTGLVKRIEDLENAVGEGGSVETQIKAITGTPDNNKTLQDEIDAVEASVLTLQGEDRINKINKITVNGTEVTPSDKIVAITDVASAAELGNLKTFVGEHKTDSKNASGLCAEVEANAAAIAAEKSRAEGVESDLQGAIDKLNGTTDSTSVSKKIADAINGLDATVGSTTIATGKHVAVQVVEADGKLAGVTVTESDVASADSLSKLQAVVGYSELASSGQDSKTVKTRLEAAESAITTLNGASIVDGSVDQKVATAITNLVNGADARFDTLKEISDFILSDISGSAGLVNAVSNLQALTGLSGKLGTTGQDAKTLVARLAELEGMTALSDTEIETAFNPPAAE